MKRLLLTTLSLLVIAMGAMAVPAKRGLWRTITLSDGTEVRAQLVGDEHAHFWVTENGERYEVQNNVFVPVTAEAIQQKVAQHRAQLKTQRRAMRRITMGGRTHYTGQKKGIVILVQYTDVKFQSSNNLEKYKSLLNEEGYSDGDFRGSVSDYFKAQSGGIFELDFDVVGPYTLSNNQKYYGENDEDGYDMHAEDMIVEAVKLAHADTEAKINFADYDWDGDGYVDQVFVVYAGKGEADSYDADDTVWPHMYELSAVKKTLKYDGVTIDTYACSNEIDYYGSIEGIGCFCHEFSHCLGYADLYDTVDNEEFGMGEFDLMCGGSYNGNTFCPAGYSAYEKWMAGWLEPVELSDSDMVITNLKPISEGGGAYVIYNKADTLEYYTIENRQKTNWDAELPGKGLMITHVDFDQDLWDLNVPNSILTKSSDYVKYYGYPTNDHQRLTIFHADNTDSDRSQSTDLYPYNGKDSLTNASTPKAALYNANTDGSKLMNKGILNITQNSDRTMSFNFRATQAVECDTATVVPHPTGDYLFYESFDQCEGTGGNDNQWSESVASGKFLTDNDGWESEKAYGGNQCAKFGTGKVTGEATTPAFTVDGEATLTFKAGAWNADKDGTTLLLEVSSGTIIPDSVTIVKGEWGEYTATITANGQVKITFEQMKGRFFLDEVKVVDPTVTAISTLTVPSATAKRIYTIDGRYVGTDASVLRRGIYIINGKKVVK